MMPFMATRAYREERTKELLGTLFGDAAFPTFQPRLARNVRRSVIHDRLEAAGADFMVLSGYEVPEWFADPGVSHERPQGWGRDQAFDAVANEHRAVREAVGVMDMSFMAKLWVEGPHALDLLNRVSVSEIDVPVGKIVYTHWCTPNGGIWTDLTVTRLADERFLVIGADIIHRRMIAWLERHRRDDEFATVTDMTTARTLLSVQGPRSRELLSRLTTADLSNEAFPYMRAREIDVAMGEALAIRVTYLGELGWELHIPNDVALHVYDALIEVGRDLGLRHAGIGALNSLRLEKAYRDYGLDIDNEDTLLDVDLSFTIAWDKPSGFVGKDALVKQRDSGVRTSRMVQVLVQDPEPLLYGHEQLYRDGEHVGEVRNGAYGHTLGGGVGLAIVERDDDITDDFLASGSWELDIVAKRYPVSVSLTPMYDPTRSRIRA
jgi:4-methylaminobutanoate oxidase (formaldehyde-forming)